MTRVSALKQWATRMNATSSIPLPREAERLWEIIETLSARVENLTRKLEQPAFEEKPAEKEVAAVAARETTRQIKPALPLPKLVRQIIRNRQARGRFLDGNLFADPAWDMILDLTAARAEQKRVSVTSLCIASGVPPTTALRWIAQMVEQGLFVRIGDCTDRRRAFIDLSDNCSDAVARYFAETGTSEHR